MEFAEFHFVRPWWFLALLPTALLLFWLFKNKQRQGNWSEVCDPELLPFLLQEKPSEKRSRGLVTGGLATVLTIFALAGPTWERLPTPAFRNEAALVIALDLSDSMDAADIKPSRIVQARYKIADLLKLRKDGQTALLVYGGDAFTVTPLTSDIATITSQLEALTTDIMPSPGRNTGLAIQKAVELLQQAGAVQGHILLVTDGVDSHGIEAARQKLGNYRLSVLAMGTAAGAPIQQSGGSLVKDANGNIIMAHLDSNALSALAKTGQGIYQAVTAGDEDVETLSKVLNTINAEDKAADNNLLLQQWDEKGPWLLFLIMPWAAMRFRRGRLFWLSICILPMLPEESQALDWQSLWKTPNQQAQQAYSQQQFQQAAEQFDNPEWRAAAQYKSGQYQQAAEILKDSKTVDGLYNRGNALAQAGQYQEAIQAYDQALKLDPAHQDAQYNKSLVEKKLQEQQKQQSKDNQKSDQKSEQDKQQDQQSGQSDQQNQADANQADNKQANENQAGEQQDAEQKPAQNQQADQESSKPAETKPESENKQDQQNAVKQQQENQSDQDSKDAQAQTAKSVAKNELDRANEQLLKRVPDEPTGLLKRKFKHLYEQRRSNGQDDQ